MEILVYIIYISMILAACFGGKKRFNLNKTLWKRSPVKIVLECHQNLVTQKGIKADI